MTSDPRVTIVVDPPDFLPGDLRIEPSAQVRARIAAGAAGWILDPQHGGSHLPHGDFVGWVDSGLAEATAAACTAALMLLCWPRRSELPAGWLRRLVLESRAGLDDYTAAAVLLGAGASEDARCRIEAVARADNASYEGLGPWHPGQRLETVETSFPGLSRLCACQSMPVTRRVELVGEWLRTGDVYLSAAEVELLDPDGLDCMTAPPAEGDRAVTSHLGWVDRVARRDLAAGRERMRVTHHRPVCGACHGTRKVQQIGGSPITEDCLLCEASHPLVALVESQLTGLSAGRGALARGYEEAPIVVAASELSGGARQVTIARATNAAGQVALNWTALRDTLNWEERAHWQFGPTLDPAPGLWGGNPTSCILGSPKPAGTRLPLATIVEFVCQHARWM